MYQHFVDWVKKHHSTKIILFFAAISIFCYVLMGTNIFGIQSEFDNKYMLDLVFYYSGETFFDTLTNIPDVQAEYYLITHYVDYIFIATFYPMLVLIASKRIKKNTQILLLAPIIAMIFDFLENLIIDIQLTNGVSVGLGNICGLFTALKFTYIGISILFILVNFVKHRRDLKHANL